MKIRLGLIALALAASGLAAADLRGQQADQSSTTLQGPMMQMMGAMHANDQKIDDLVKKMNAAKGDAKINAMADLLTVLVQERQGTHMMGSSMSTMMGMMANMKGAMGTTHSAGTSEATPEK